MTYIQPDHYKKNILNLVLAGLIFTSLVGVFWLIALYNSIVNLDHTIAAAKTELDAIGVQNTTLNQQVATALGNISSGDLAAANGLIQDNHPTYIKQSWPIASQQ